ncbi:MAG: hypothetical protein CL961_00395 [Euryarchaeota archaeon]|nr:hypothetical protein [Euryarchaeota archaeon]
MKKIGFVTTDLTVGGAQTWLVNITRLLADFGHEVHIFLLAPRISLPPSHDVHLHFVCKNGKYNSSRWLKRYAPEKLYEFVDRLGPFNLIISTLPFSDKICKKSGIKPIVYRIANTLSEEIKFLGRLKGIRRKYFYKTLYKNQKLISVSNGVTEDLVKYFSFERTNISTINNPIDINRLTEMAARYEPQIDSPYLLHSGRFARQKRHDVLLDSFAHYLKISQSHEPKKLVLLCQKEKKLNEMIKARGLADSVLNIGFQQNPFPWYLKSSCNILASDREGMPNIILESIALATPVASTDCPSGPKEILGKNFPQCIAQIGNPVSLANAIRNALACKINPRLDLPPDFQVDSAVAKIIDLSK